MKYTLLHRKITKSFDSHEDFVRWMRKSDPVKLKCNFKFMEEYAFRKKTFHKIDLNFDTVDGFVEDLIKHHFLEIAERNTLWIKIKNSIEYWLRIILLEALSSTRYSRVQ